MRNPKKEIAALAGLIVLSFAFYPLLDSPALRDSALFSAFQTKTWHKTESDREFLEEIRSVRFGIPYSEALSRYGLEPAAPGGTLKSAGRKLEASLSPSGTLESLSVTHVLDRGADPKAFLAEAENALRALDPEAEITRASPRIKLDCEKAENRRLPLCSGALSGLSFAGPRVKGSLLIAPELSSDGSVTEAVLVIRAASSP